MRSKISTLFAALALAAIAGTSFAQNGPVGRAANDGGMITEPNQNQTQVPQYNSSGAVVGAPANEISGNNCAARFRSFDPASGTYRGLDGRRHPCP